MRILFYIVMLGLPALSLGQGRELSGTVSHEGVPVEQALVVVSTVNNKPLHVSTNSLGQFHFHGLTDSTYLLSVNMIGFRPYRQHIVFGESRAMSLTILLTEEVHELPSVTITSLSRVDRKADEVLSISVIDQKMLNEQSHISTNLNDILSKTVPGVAQSTESASNWGQGIRGRDMSVMIDGIPQSAPIRNSSRELRSIDIASIEEIEVIRGATALYGHGATGGIIHYITKRPGRMKDTVLFLSCLSGGSSLVFRKDAFRKIDPLGGRIMQQVMARKKRWGMLANASYEKTGKYYDAEGDLIPLDPLGQGGFTNSNAYSALGKVSYELNNRSSVEVKGLYYHSIQTPGYVSMPGEYGVRKATASPSLYYADEMGTAMKNLNLSARYATDTLFTNTSMQITAFYQDMYVRFAYDPNSSFFPAYQGRTSAQSYLTSEKAGSRIDFKTYLPALRNSYIQYGLDAVKDATRQPLTDGRIWVPLIHQFNIAPFVQAKYVPSSRWILRGGIRYETVVLKMNDFAQIGSGKVVKGGTLDYHQWLFNAGIRYKMHRMFAPYIAFGQGFATTEVGREVRGTAASSITELKPKAQLVNNYEVGFSSTLGIYELNAAVYYNTSRYGVTLLGTSFDVERAPEKVYGFEIVQHLKLSRSGITAQISYTEGKKDPENNGSYNEYLLGSRIPPLKITGMFRQDITSRFHAAIQCMYSGSRNRFENKTGGFGTGKVSSYLLFDLSAGYVLWKGELSLGISNLFNSFYFPTASQWANSSRTYVAGRGRAFAITYTIHY